MRAEDEPRVVRHVQPLVRIGRPRVGTLDAAYEMAKLRRSGRPETERAVDVQPGSTSGDGVRNCVEIVESPGVHLACLRADDRRPLVESQRCDIHAALVVRRQDVDLCAADPEEAERAVDRRMTHLPADAAKRCGAGGAPTGAGGGGGGAGGGGAWAIWQPVTTPTERSAGRPRSSASQTRQTSSTTAADGPPT